MRKPHRFKEAKGFVQPSGKLKIPISLDADLLERINAIAKAEDVSVTVTVARILDEKLSEANLRSTLDRMREMAAAERALALTPEEIELIMTHRRLFGRG